MMAVRKPHKPSHVNEVGTLERIGLVLVYMAILLTLIAWKVVVAATVIAWEVFAS